MNPISACIRPRVTVAALALLVACSGGVASADELAREANVALVLNVADMATTRALFIRSPYAFERNPIARPFVRSDAAALGYAVATNLIGRFLLRHAPKAFRFIDALEVGCLLNNARVLSRPNAYDASTRIK